MDFYNGNTYNFVYEETTLPTYLKEFFMDDSKVILVYGKKDSISSEDDVSPTKSCIKKENSHNSSTLDLTGDPLKVDLEGDESFGSYVKCDRPNHWTLEESRHFPLPLKKARQYINQQNKIKTCEGEEPKPIYVICDGRDTANTVILGAHKYKNILMTTVVKIIGCLPKDHEAMSVQNMEKDHIRNTLTKNPKINYVVKFQYQVYGTSLQNCNNLYHSEHHGSICIEVTCNNCSFNVPQNPSNIKMILKIIAGHNLSSVHFLWEELCLLQSYLDVLSDSDKCNDEYSVISKTPVQESDIYRNINNLIGVSLLKREAKTVFDLNNIRQEHILDKLWNILKCCENLSVLRDSLHYFFEELVETELNIQIPENDKTNIATLINGILNGKLAVPTLTFSQALECLFELGSEKLKNDYQTIIKNFYSASDKTINVKWSTFQNQDLVSQGVVRKTRVTVNLRSGVIDLDHNVSKLAYLGKLHITTELIYLIKEQANLLEETFDYFCERVYKNYMDKDEAPYDFTDLQGSPVCEFMMNLSQADTNIIQKETPISWAAQMTSKEKNLEVTTIYQLSQHPIFPPSIYNNYDMSELTDEKRMIYYISKLVRYKEVF